MTTLEREFCSLKGLPFYDLGTAIYKGDPSRPAPVNPDTVRQVMKTYNVNESQSRAISSTIMTRGFSLIQGYAKEVLKRKHGALIFFFFSFVLKPFSLIFF